MNPVSNFPAIVTFDIPNEDLPRLFRKPTIKCPGGVTPSGYGKAYTYTYNAWGNIRSTTGMLSSNLGKYNPLRYRGYVYDTETKFYYLQSRYYNPDVGRFLNADALVSTGQSFEGNNMFVYCLSNPANRTDSNGYISYTQAEDQNNDDNPLNDVARIGNAGDAPTPTGKGFSSGNALKNFLGSAGLGKHWHHIVEKCQIGKSGFSPEQIHNTSNIIAVDGNVHAKITGYYNSKGYEFTGGLSVRDYLAGQPFRVQYEFGVAILREYGVIK